MASPHNVVVLGGGPAALATLEALREHAGPRVHLTIVAPESHASALRPRARALRADLFCGRAASVDPGRHDVVLVDGRRVTYDSLVVAVGARSRVAYTRARTFFGQAGTVALDRLLADVHDGHTRSLAFVVPPDVVWSLPLYELAIQAGAELRAAGLDVPLRFLTHERTPLELFGERAGRLVGGLLDQAGVLFRGATSVTELPGGVLREGRVGASFVRERVIALPTVQGPSLPGLPATFDGFVPVDAYGAVRGLADVFAAGAVTQYPIRQRDVAEQQGVVVAAVLAQRAGAYATPEPWVPLVRGHLLAGGGRALVLERGADAQVDDATAAARPRSAARPSLRAAVDGPCTSR